jgi:histone acetyltransferase (RNA polymerase elongator complex component)
LFGFVRLRLQDRNQHWYEELQDCAIIRELHVYGQLVPIVEVSGLPAEAPQEHRRAQHRGFGRKLMVEAEAIAKAKGFTKSAVIAGVGVRKYYEKLGYELADEYMMKSL